MAALILLMLALVLALIRARMRANRLNYNARWTARLRELDL